MGANLQYVDLGTGISCNLLLALNVDFVIVILSKEAP
jgi:hypothetical protein